MTTSTQTFETDAAPSPAPPPRRRRILKLFFRAWILLAALFFVYLWNSYRATGFDRARVFSSDATVRVTRTADSIAFTPVVPAQPTGLIFLPGSLVDPTAYAPLARTVAEHGHPTVILQLPLRFAPFPSQRDAIAARVADTIRANSSTPRWLLAGHSLGGALAARVALNPPDGLAGIVLIGTSHPRDFDLSQTPLDVTKITATLDGLASPEEVKANAPKLPPTTHWIQIKGGNHSQFGYYGSQLGDHRATIPRAEQQARTAEAIFDALARITPRAD